MTRRSLSLIEVIVAASLLVVALMGIMVLVLSATSLTRVSRERAQAVALADARIAQLRATLRSADVEANRAAQFTALLTAVGPLASPGVYETAGGGQAATLSEGLTAATVTVTAYTREDTAQAQLGLTGLDLNADGTTGAATAHPADQLYMVPLRVVVTWRHANWQPGEPDSSVQVVTLLY